MNSVYFINKLLKQNNLRKTALLLLINKKIQHQSGQI